MARKHARPRDRNALDPPGPFPSGRYTFDATYVRPLRYVHTIAHYTTRPRLLGSGIGTLLLLLLLPLAPTLRAAVNCHCTVWLADEIGPKADDTIYSSGLEALPVDP